MTKQEAKALSIEVWQYLADHPECRYKWKMPGKLFDQIKYLEAMCPLCQLYYYHGCRKCPIDNAGKNCLGFRSPWYTWSNIHKSDDIRQQAAQKILGIIQAWEVEE